MASRREDTRIERDSMGEVEVPASALWGASTQRAIQNFPVSGEKLPLAPDPRARALIKAAAAAANRELGVLDEPRARAIEQAAREVAEGKPRRAVRARRVPDRLGNLDQHERERGDRAARRAAARVRSRAPSIPTIT